MISPDFSRYLVVDKKDRQFKIKDVYSEQTICTIPKHLMTYARKEDPKFVTNRFRFLDHKTFIISNEIGIEKKIEIKDDNKLVEIAYNKRPLFNEIQGEEWKSVKYYF